VMFLLVFVVLVMPVAMAVRLLVGLMFLGLAEAEHSSLCYQAIVADVRGKDGPPCGESDQLQRLP
jgi:hypothetical protein